MMNEFALSNQVISTSNSIITTPSAYFIVERGGGYSTSTNQNEQDFKSKKFDPGLIYPSACLFCGIPNGEPKATITIPYDPCITNAPTMQYYKENNNMALLLAAEQNVLTRIHSTFKKIKRFFIRKYIYSIIMFNNKKKITFS